MAEKTEVRKRWRQRWGQKGCGTSPSGPCVRLGWKLYYVFAFVCGWLNAAGCWRAGLLQGIHGGGQIDWTADPREVEIHVAQHRSRGDQIPTATAEQTTQSSQQDRSKRTIAEAGRDAMGCMAQRDQGFHPCTKEKAREGAREDGVGTSESTQRRRRSQEWCGGQRGANGRRGRPRAAVGNN